MQFSMILTTAVHQFNSRNVYFMYVIKKVLIRCYRHNIGSMQWNIDTFTILLYISPYTLTLWNMLKKTRCNHFNFCLQTLKKFSFATNDIDRNSFEFMSSFSRERIALGCHKSTLWRQNARPAEIPICNKLFISFLP